MADRSEIDRILAENGKYVLDLASTLPYCPALETDAGFVRGDVHAELFDRLAHEVRDLREDWDNRLVLERSSLAELYLNGRLEIVLYGDWPIGTDHNYWACRVTAEATIMHDVSAHAGVDVADHDDRHGWDNQVVLVEVVETVKSPKTLVPSTVRTYLFEKQFFGTGEGLLYRRENMVGFDVFPFGSHGKVWIDRSLGNGKGAENARRQMIQCSPEIMDRITDDECQRLWDWLFGPIGKLVHGRVQLDHRSAHFSECDFIEAAVKRIGHAPQLVNVAVGPLNL